MYLNEIKAFKTLNSRNEETIEVFVKTKNNISSCCSAPSGKSKGKYEVRDFSVKGIDFSICFVNVIGKKIVNEKMRFDSFSDLSKIEELIKRYDKTERLEFIGGNCLYALEGAILRAMAKENNQELWKFLLEKKKPSLPKPLGNCIGGGLHVKQERKIDFQEILFMPKTKSFFDAAFINKNIYSEAKEMLKTFDKDWKGTLTDENALASTLSDQKVLELVKKIKEKTENRFDIKVVVGIDFAASTFYVAKKYRYRNFSSVKKETSLTVEEQLSYVKKLSEEGFTYLEDPFHCDDFESFSKLLKQVSKDTLVCGDDLTCTNLERVKKAVKMKAINALIVKPNQIGSLIETKKVVDFGKKHNLNLIISHRSGETKDDLIADLSVGWQIPLIKTGIVGKEREAKINKLIKIEKQLWKS